MHHPARPQLPERILPLLAADARIVTDPDPDGKPSPWRTHEACLASMREDCSHLLVVQDDALPAPGFPAAALRAVAERPDVLVSFYLGQQPAREARKMIAAAKAGERWMELVVAQWCPTVALAWPREIAERILTSQHRPARRADDFMVGRWAHHRGVQVWATVPSLVDHVDDIPSIAGDRWGTTWRCAAVVSADAGDW